MGDICVPEKSKVISQTLSVQAGATGTEARRTADHMLGRQEIMVDPIWFIPVAHIAAHAAIRASSAHREPPWSSVKRQRSRHPSQTKEVIGMWTYPGQEVR
jgi:hypothetical protein